MTNLAHMTEMDRYNLGMDAFAHACLMANEVDYISQSYSRSWERWPDSLTEHRYIAPMTDEDYLPF